MGLPLTINTAYGSSDPVLSADLVAMQECIAYDLHPSRTIVIPASHFQPKINGRGAGGSTALLGDHQWVWGGFAPCIVVAPISHLIPEGHELETIRWYYNRAGAGAPTRAAYARNLGTGAADAAIFGPTAIAAGAAWASVDDDLATLLGAAYIMPANVAIDLEFNLTNAAHVFGGAAITYRKLP